MRARSCRIVAMTTIPFSCVLVANGEGMKVRTATLPTKPDPMYVVPFKYLMSMGLKKLYEVDSIV